MNRTVRGTETRGVYAVYWEQEEDKGGYIETAVVPPKDDKTPKGVKLMILQALLDDLNIPIQIDKHRIPSK